MLPIGVCFGSQRQLLSAPPPAMRKAKIGIERRGSRRIQNWVIEIERFGRRIDRTIVNLRRIRTVAELLAQQVENRGVVKQEMIGRLLALRTAFPTG